MEEDTYLEYVEENEDIRILFTNAIWDNAEYLYIRKESNLIYPSNIVRGRYHKEFLWNIYDDYRNQWQNNVIFYINFSNS